MFTHLPYRDFEASALALTDDDLERQIIHSIMLLDALHESDFSATRAWGNHPAALMWKGYEVQLALYGLAMQGAWYLRGKGGENSEKRLQWHFETATTPDDFKMEKPLWFDDDSKMSRLERTSRSLLIARNPDAYSKKWPGIPKDLPAYFPLANGQE